MVRLQKAIADLGYCSRRKAEELISNGFVQVNGVVIKELGTKVNGDEDIIVEGNSLNKVQKKIYILLNKPRNTVSTVNDPEGRKTVMDYLKDIQNRVFPVGRLDYNTTGALLFTNDGELANKLTHPSHEVEKAYLVTVLAKIPKEKLKLLATGVEIEGRLTSPAIIEVLKESEEKSILRITIHEGRNHIIKNMLEAIGYEVAKLNRESFAGIDCRGLYEGQYRMLTKQEVQYLKTL
jgi:pseudouridine synthase